MSLPEQNVRNLISLQDMDTAWWDSLYALYREIAARPGDFGDACRGRLMASLFFEPSTRTSFSFQAAMLRLGGSVFGFSNPNDTSVSKGERLADTIRMTASYADVIVMRSPWEGAATAAALYSHVPIINAGDGGHLHPTQTLTDLTTIAETRGGIGRFTLGLCGDLKYGRTVHSLVTALARFPAVRFVLIAPDALKMPGYMLDFMRAAGLPFYECASLDEAMPELDVLYMTRAQAERFAKRSAAVYDERFILTPDKLLRAKPDLTILHPLPRTREIAPEVDSDPRAKYFDQARYGMFIRMALLFRMAHMERAAPAPLSGGGHSCGNETCITQSEPYLPGIATADGRCGYCDK